VNGRWDGERLRGQAWWPKQSLTVFQPLIPPDWKMTLRDGNSMRRWPSRRRPIRALRPAGTGAEIRQRLDAG
jgi:hypothetical protein